MSKSAASASQQGILHITELPNAALKSVTQNSAAQAIHPPLVFLHGWGCDSAIWSDFPELLVSNPEYGLSDRQVLLVDLPGFGLSSAAVSCTEDDILDLLAAALPPRAVLIGWSLGGMLATAFAAKWPERVESLIAIGTNASYCQRENWSHAVPEQKLGEFISQLAENPKQCLKRFRANQVRNDQHEKPLLRQLAKLATKEEINATWPTMLELLGAMDNRQALTHLSSNTLYLFGEHDQLVPLAVVDQLAALNPRIQTHIFPGVSHVPHLSCPERLASCVADFLRGQRNLDKRLVRQSFGRSAPSYDRVAHLQRDVGEQLFGYLGPHLANLPEQDWVMDLGCGTGHFLKPIVTSLSRGRVLGLDLSEGMLQFAREKLHAQDISDIQWACGDAEQLPLASDSLSLIYSNLAVQWCEDVPALVRELYRVLKPGGTAIISTLGDRTLHEMRSSWQQVDDQVHVNGFLTLEALQAFLAEQPFSRSQIEEQSKLTEYSDVYALSRELKALGAHNVNAGRPKGMTGRKRLKQFAEAYEDFRSPGEGGVEGLLPATWQVFYLQLSKPPAD